MKPDNTKDNKDDLIKLLKKPLSGGKEDVDAIEACKRTWKMDCRND